MFLLNLHILAAMSSLQELAVAAAAQAALRAEYEKKLRSDFRVGFRFISYEAVCRSTSLSLSLYLSLSVYLSLVLSISPCYRLNTIGQTSNARPKPVGQQPTV